MRMMKIAKSLLFVVMAGVMMGQIPLTSYSPPVGPEPDCKIAFNFTANTGISYPNMNTGCSYWVVTYSATDAASLTLTFQDAPIASLGAPSGVPPYWQQTYGTAGTYVSFAGTVVSGVNPNTALTQGQTIMTGYFPWVKINLTNLTGGGATVVGTVWGYRLGPSSGGGPASGCVGTVTTPCVVTQQVCTSATVTLTSSGLTQLIALSGGKVITVCGYSVSFNGTETTFQLEYGTGSSCGTGTTAVTGNYQTVNSIAINTPFSIPASQALCANLGSNTTGGGMISYVQQ